MRALAVTWLAIICYPIAHGCELACNHRLKPGGAFHCVFSGAFHCVDGGTFLTVTESTQRASLALGSEPYWQIRTIMKLGDTIPAFSATTNLGKIDNFHEWIGESWAILFSHPADFTPVCTTELARAAQLAEKFQERNVQMIALSCDSPESHRGWINDIVAYAKDPNVTNDGFPFEIIADEDRKLAVELGMLDPAEKDSKGMPLTARAVFIIDPSKKLRAQILYPATTGRNFDEILRVIDSMQLSDRTPIATPEGWKNIKEACMVQPSVPMSKAEELFGKVNIVQLPSGKSYLRQVNLAE